MTKRGRLPTLGARVAQASTRTPTMQPGLWRTSAQTSSQRGYGYRWQKARAAFLREHPFCVYCLRERRITLALAVLIGALRYVAQQSIKPDEQQPTDQP